MILDNYCECCGVKNSIILAELQKIERTTPREWNGHKKYDKQEGFYSGLIVEYCAECGEKLADDDFITHEENRGEFGGRLVSETVFDGYTCSSCGVYYEN